VEFEMEPSGIRDINISFMLRLTLAFLPRALKFDLCVDYAVRESRHTVAAAIDTSNECRGPGGHSADTGTIEFFLHG